MVLKFTKIFKYKIKLEKMQSFSKIAKVNVGLIEAFTVYIPIED